MSPQSSVVFWLEESDLIFNGVEYTLDQFGMYAVFVYRV